MRWVVSIVLGVPTAYLLAGLGLALIPVNRDFISPENGIEIQLVSNGIHVDFLLPIKTSIQDWSTKLPKAAFPAAGDDATHLLFGWGSRVFYLETPTWADLKVSNVVKAVFWPGATVVHAQYVPGVFETSPACRTVRLSEAAYSKLCDYVERSFQRDASGAFQLIVGKGYGESDNFFEATGSYHAFNTCNSWTNRGLKEIGVRTSLWSPLPFGILWHLE